MLETTLQIDFNADGGDMTPFIFQRNSVAWYRDYDGHWFTVPANVPRAFDFRHHIQLGKFFEMYSPIGLIVEPASSNSINSIMQGADSGVFPDGWLSEGDAFLTCLGETEYYGLPAVELNFGSVPTTTEVVMLWFMDPEPISSEHYCLSMIYSGNDVGLSVEFVFEETIGGSLPLIQTLNIDGRSNDYGMGAHVCEPFFPVKPIRAESDSYRVGVRFTKYSAMPFPPSNMVISAPQCEPLPFRTTPIIGSGGATRDADYCALGGDDFEEAWGVSAHSVAVRSVLLTGSESGCGVYMRDGESADTLLVSPQHATINVSGNAEILPHGSTLSVITLNSVGAALGKNFTVSRNGRAPEFISAPATEFSYCEISAATGTVGIAEISFFDSELNSGELIEASGQIPFLADYMRFDYGPLYLAPSIADPSNGVAYRFFEAAGRNLNTQDIYDGVFQDYIVNHLRASFDVDFPEGDNAEFHEWIKETGYYLPYTYGGVITMPNGAYLFAILYGQACGEWPEGMTLGSEIDMYVREIPLFQDADFTYIPSASEPFKLLLSTFNWGPMLSLDYAENVIPDELVIGSTLYFGQPSIATNPLEYYREVSGVTAPSAFDVITLTPARGETIITAVLQGYTDQPSNVTCNTLVLRAREIFGLDFILDYARFMYPFADEVPAILGPVERLFLPKLKNFSYPGGVRYHLMQAFTENFNRKKGE